MSWLDDVHGEKLQRAQAAREAHRAQEQETRARSADAFASDPRVIVNRQVLAYALGLDDLVRGRLEDVGRLTWGAGKFEFVEYATDRKAPRGATLVDYSGAIVDLFDAPDVIHPLPQLAAWTVRGPLISSHATPPVHGVTGRTYTYPYYRVTIDFDEAGAPTFLGCEEGQKTAPPVTEVGLRELLKVYYLAGPSIGQWSRS